MVKLLDIASSEGLTPVYQDDDGRVYFLADGDIDADGANGQSNPKLAAYRPDDTGLELLANAGYPKHPEWYQDILVCVNGKPIVQRPCDPAPGAFISKTAYLHPGLNPTDPSAYVDSAIIPYIVVPPEIRRRARGVVLGCVAKVTHVETGASVKAVVADIGPRNKCGELSMAAAKALGIRWNPRTGGTSDFVLRYELWPGKAAKGFRLIPA